MFELWRPSTCAPSLPTLNWLVFYTSNRSHLSRSYSHSESFCGRSSFEAEKHKHPIPITVSDARKFSSEPCWVRTSADPHLALKVSSTLEAMSFWTCASCTFVNQGSSTKCEMCEQTRKPISSSTRSPGAYLSVNSSQEDTSKWGCRACTFRNKGSDKRCDICGTPRSSISLDSFAEIDSTLDESTEDGGTKFWPLRSCTGSFSQSQESSQRHETSSISVSASSMANKEKKRQEDMKRKYNEDNNGAFSSTESDHVSSSGVSNALLKNLHLEKMQRNKQSQAGVHEESLSLPPIPSLASDSSSVKDDNQCLVILTYNVWFREDLELTARMNAIGAIISQHNPHFICFQEVTPAIFAMFQRSSWWGSYKCSLTPEMAGRRAYFCLLLSRMASTSFHRNSYQNTVMGRELCIAGADADGGRQVHVATTHLESPCPAPPTWDQMYSQQRVVQMKEALNALKEHRNVVFGGDMNWDDKLDGSPPLPANWCDAWLTLRPNEEGLTYDSKENPMLTGSRLRKRLDRIFCRLEDYRLESIEIVGTKPIPGVTFEKEMKSKKQSKKVKLPVLPSDHFGLLLKITQKQGSF